MMDSLEIQADSGNSDVSNAEQDVASSHRKLESLPASISECPTCVEDATAFSSQPIRVSWLARLRSIILLLALTYATLFVGLGSSRLWDRDEPRNGRCAVEMLAANNWIVPTFNDQLRTHKPILLYWVQMASYSVFGINEFSARFGSALAGLGTVLVVYWMGWLGSGHRTAFWTSAALAGSLMFVVASRAATPDALLIFFSTLGVACFAHSFLRPNRYSGFVKAIGYLALGCAVLAKGPVGIILPGAVAAIWVFIELHLSSTGSTRANTTQTGATWPFQNLHSRNNSTDSTTKAIPNFVWFRAIRNWLTGLSSSACRSITDLGSIRSTLRFFRPISGMLLALAIATPWYVLVGLRTDGEWLRGFFWDHNFGRAIGSMEGHRGGLLFYPIAMMVGLFPWSLILVPILAWVLTAIRGRSPSASMCRLGVIWIAVYVLAFTLAKTKLPSYITPCYAGAALMIGGCISDWSSGRFIIGSALARMASCVIAIAAIVVGGAILIGARQLKMPDVSIHSLWSLGLIVCSAFWMWGRSQNSSQRNFAGGLLASFAMLIGGLYTYGAPAVDAYRTDLDMMTVNRFHQHDGQSSECDWMCIGTIEPSWVFYLDRPIREIEYIPGQFGTSNEGFDWREAARQHLSRSNARLILPTELIDELKSSVSSNGLVFTDEIARSHRFLKSKSISIVRSIELNDTQLSVKLSKGEGLIRKLDRQTIDLR